MKKSNLAKKVTDYIMQLPIDAVFSPKHIMDDLEIKKNERARKGVTIRRRIVILEQEKVLEKACYGRYRKISNNPVKPKKIKRQYQEYVAYRGAMYNSVEAFCKHEHITRKSFDAQTQKFYYKRYQIFKTKNIAEAEYYAKYFAKAEQIVYNT